MNFCFCAGNTALEGENRRGSKHFSNETSMDNRGDHRRASYDLTGAQKNVWHEIERDLSGHKLMSRLVQGMLVAARP